MNRNKEVKNHEIFGYIINSLGRDVCLHSNNNSIDFYERNLSLTFYLLQQVAVGLSVIYLLDCATRLFLLNRISLFLSIFTVEPLGQFHTPLQI